MRARGGAQRTGVFGGLVLGWLLVPLLGSGPSDSPAAAAIHQIGPLGAGWGLDPTTGSRPLG